MEEFHAISHTFEPVYDVHSQILILGTFPSVKSREQEFYYGHPQNRFWKVLAGLFREEVPYEIKDKKTFLLTHHIAVWDVISRCDIKGSSDSSIRNVEVTDISRILNVCEIKNIFANGAKAAALYQKYSFPQTKRAIITLPSTSPANAAYSLERLAECWKIVRESL